MREAYSDKLKVKLACELAAPGMSALDIGCGKGRVSIPLSLICSVTSLDTDPDAVRSLSAKGIRTIEASAEAIPLPGASFDLVVCVSTLAHVASPADALSEIVRVMRPGGRALIELRGKRNANTRFWDGYYAPSPHSWTLPEAKTAIKSAGLTVERSRATGWTRGHLYLPILKNSPWLADLFHSGREPDLDYRLSNLPPFRPFASNWFFIASKPAACIPPPLGQNAQRR